MISINKLTKKYGERTALAEVSLTIGQGEIFGLLGPNGAGKTTLIRILNRLTAFDSGEITMQGTPLTMNSKALQTAIGLVPQHINLDGELTVLENLELHGRLYHLPKEERKVRIKELLSYVELADRADDFVQKLSGGMKRRLMIARALLHQPRLLFLDEPTVGLDPQVRRRLWDLILSLSSQGLTVLLTTHYIEEAEALCQRVAIMEKGRLIACDTPQAMRQKLGTYAVEWVDSAGIKTEFFTERPKALSFIEQLAGNAVLRDTNLEDVFVELTGRKVSP
ncbi:MAG: ABC transporter ATP-binding protein [Pelosinus sp.]|nr:ABC transporter ATP-binding protein [Pelosinus sp.]